MNASSAGEMSLRQIGQVPIDSIIMHLHSRVGTFSMTICEV